MTTITRESTTPRLGLIGCGAIAEIYHLPALVADPDRQSRLVLVDPNADRRHRLCNRFGVAQSCHDYRGLVGQVDGVVIATPPALHHEIAKYFLERSVPVLCEKPLTESAVEARDLCDLADQHRVALAVNQTRRLFPTYGRIRELIHEGVLGSLRRITYCDGFKFDWPAASAFHFQPGAKGVLSDTGIHLLDTICWWLQSTPILVDSLTDSEGGPEALATLRLQHQDCEIELKVSRLGRLPNRFRVEGSNGWIEAGVEDWSMVRVNFHDGKARTIRVRSAPRTYAEFARPLIENFCQVIQGKAAPLVPGRETVGAIELLEEAYQAARPYPPLAATETSTREELLTVHSSPAPVGRVLVTGAAGFVGGRIVEWLHASGVANPVAAIRHWSRAARVARLAISTIVCDILEPEQVRAAVRGVDAIVHCAYTDDRNSIVEGTRHLLDAAVAEGVSRLVMLSTAEVYGPTVSGEVSEDHPCPKTDAVYASAKIEAENLCRTYASRGVSVTILRPSIVHGPFGQSWTIDIAKRLLSGNWRRFDGHGDGVANLVYVDDLAQAVYLALTSTSSKGEAFNINGPDRLTWNDYFDHLNAALGLPPLVASSAKSTQRRTAFMHAVRRTIEPIRDRFRDRLMEIYLRNGWPSRLMKRLKHAMETTPTVGELYGLYARQAHYDDSKARRLLGYQPQYDLERALTVVVPWLQRHELIPTGPLQPIRGTDLRQARNSTGSGGVSADRSPLGASR